MIEKIARRAGGFAATTALRWMSAGAEVLPDAVVPDAVLPEGKSGGKVAQRVAAGAAAGAVALLSSDKVRSGLERGLLAAARSIRPDGSNGASSNGASRNGSSRKPASSNGSSRNGSNGNGSHDLTAKTRAELYELAKKAGLAGRSAMSKDDLVKALTG